MVKSMPPNELNTKNSSFLTLLSIVHEVISQTELQGSKISLVRSYLRVPQAAGQVKILIFLVKIKLFPYMPIVFVMQGKCLFSDISRPELLPT